MFKTEHCLIIILLLCINMTCVNHATEQRVLGAYHFAKKFGWNNRCIKEIYFPNLLTNRMRMALTIYYPAFTRSHANFTGKGLETKLFSQIVHRSERKKWTTSGGCPQFQKIFSGKLLFHLTSNQNFRILWLNSKHPKSSLTMNLLLLMKHEMPRSVMF